VANHEIRVSLDRVAEKREIDTRRLERLARHVFTSEGVAWRSLGIVLTGHARVRELNKEFLNHDYNTDVLSFLIEENGEGIEGEVYVDVETAAERHVEFGMTLQGEIERYVVHGVLHLAGHDDRGREARLRMQQLESTYLAVDE
jgi:rRNA maturation RNase YbeY